MSMGGSLGIRSHGAVAAVVCGLTVVLTVLVGAGAAVGQADGYSTPTPGGETFTKTPPVAVAGLNAGRQPATAVEGTQASRFAFTGADIIELVAIGVATALGGVALVVTTRRRRRRAPVLA